jgi:hypothetical protein
MSLDFGARRGARWSIKTPGFRTPFLLTPEDSLALTALIDGLDLTKTDGSRIKYTDALTCYVADAKDSDTPIAAVFATVAMIAAGEFTIVFDATGTDAIVETSPGLEEDTPIFLILQGAGALRAYIPGFVKLARSLKSVPIP